MLQAGVCPRDGLFARYELVGQVQTKGRGSEGKDTLISVSCFSFTRDQSQRFQLKTSIALHLHPLSPQVLFYTNCTRSVYVAGFLVLLFVLPFASACSGTYTGDWHVPSTVTNETTPCKVTGNVKIQGVQCRVELGKGTVELVWLLCLRGL